MRQQYQFNSGEYSSDSIKYVFMIIILIILGLLVISNVWVSDKSIKSSKIPDNIININHKNI